MTEKTISDIGEFGLIKLISHDLIYRPEFVKIGPGDDGAVYSIPDGFDQVISTDTMVEGIHFTSVTMSAYDVGWKLCASNFGDMASGNRQLKITIPENLNYTDAFNEVFDSYTTNSQLRKVKTTNMGTMFELTYTVALKKDVNEKNFIDALRVKNGNLNIVLGIPETESTNLN